MHVLMQVEEAVEQDSGSQPVLDKLLSLVGSGHASYQLRNAVG